MTRRPFLKSLTALALAAGLSLTGLAANAAEWGPDLGTERLSGLTATTADGTTVALDALAKDSDGLVVAFVRSAEWCGFCKRQLVELSKRHDDFAARGLTLVSISYDDTDILAGFGAQQDIAYTMLSDPDSTIIDAFGIRNETQKPGTAGYGIPHPGIMVFDPSGKLTHKFAEKSYSKRPKIDDVLAAIDASR